MNGFDPSITLRQSVVLPLHYTGLLPGIISPPGRIGPTRQW